MFDLANVQIGQAISVDLCGLQKLRIHFSLSLIQVIFNQDKDVKNEYL